MYKLRGHHLFCLLGYRGMGYSKEYVINMTQLHQTLRNNPETLIELIEGPDHLCEKYPNTGEYHCKDSNIYNRDAVILKIMGLQLGGKYMWAEIEKRVKKYVIPTDIQSVCETCHWKSYGVCEDGIQHIIDGKGLWEVK